MCCLCDRIGQRQHGEFGKDITVLAVAGMLTELGFPFCQIQRTTENPATDDILPFPDWLRARQSSVLTIRTPYLYVSRNQRWEFGPSTLIMRTDTVWRCRSIHVVFGGAEELEQKPVTIHNALTEYRI